MNDSALSMTLPTYATDTQNVTEAQYVFARYTWTTFVKEFCPLALSVDRYITPIWYIIGIFGNVLSAKIWMEKRMRTNNSSAVYLATLALSDMSFLVLHTLQELKYAWDVETLAYPGICEGYFLLVMVMQYLSPILVLGFTIERWIAVCHPFKKEKYCTTGRALKVVVCLVLIAISLCTMQAYLWTYNHKTQICTVRADAQIGKASLFIVWTWITEMLIFLIVPLVILLFNILVICEVRKLSKSGQTFIPGQVKSSGHASRATTVMLLSVSFYVIFTTLPSSLVYSIHSQFPEGNLYHTDFQILQDPTWTKYRVYLTGRKIVEEICLSHYACNFFLYMITGVHFRKAVLETFKCRMFLGMKGSNYSEINHKTIWHNANTTKV